MAGGLPNIHLGVTSTDLGTSPFPITFCEQAGGDGGKLLTGSCVNPTGVAYVVDGKGFLVAHPDISLRRQCQLVGLSRTGYYYQPVQESPEELLLLRLIDQQYTRTPYCGSRRMATSLRKLRYQIVLPGFNRSFGMTSITS